MAQSAIKLEKSENELFHAMQRANARALYGE